MSSTFIIIVNAQASRNNSILENGSAIRLWY